MKKVKLITSSLTLLALLIIWGMTGWAQGLKDYEAPEMMIFLGRFHPMVLHMPIGLMFLALILDFGLLLPQKWRSSIPDTKWLYGLIVLTTTGTVVHGILLYAGGGYEGSELANRHLYRGCIFLTIIAVIFLVKLWFSHSLKTRLLGLPMAIIAMLALSISAHDGASLTHGENYLSQHAPPPLKPLLQPGYKKPLMVETKDPILEQNIYQTAIQPIFDRTCVECHKASKSKGKLRMDTYEELMKGGAGGDIVTPHDLEDSYFLELIHLPMDDDEHMPPEGKKQPTADEIKILEWWVTIGAPAEGTLGSYAPSEKILDAISNYDTLD